MKSFNFASRTNVNLTGANVKTYVAGGQQAWAASAVTFQSTLIISGFKNINVYGITAIGSISTLPSSAVNGVIVNDWTIDLTLNGQAPLIGSNIVVAPNDYNLLPFTNNNVFPISKYSNSVEFGDPYTSVVSIIFGGITASGIGWQTLNNVNLSLLFNFIVYYKFEGE